MREKAGLVNKRGFACLAIRNCQFHVRRSVYLLLFYQGDATQRARLRRWKRRSFQRFLRLCHEPNHSCSHAVVVYIYRLARGGDGCVTRDKDGRDTAERSR